MTVIISSLESTESSEGGFHPSRALIFLGVLLFLKGLIIVVGGWQIEKLQGYGLGVLSCFLAMLPGSPGCLIGLPIGLWTLLVLRRPEVRAAFGSQPVAPLPVATPAKKAALPPPRKGFFRRTFGTTTGWAMILCLLASYLIFVPWAVYSVPNHSSDWYGYETGLGIATETIFLGLFLLLLTTSFMDPPPIWRAVAMFLGGGVTVLLASLSAVGARSLEGAIGAIILGVGILLLAALQIRGILMRRWTTV
jgi:hypothetical protein